MAQAAGAPAYRIENWFLNANNYLGVVQLREQRGQTTARIHFGGHHVPPFEHNWEPVTELRLNRAIGSISFVRPNAGRHFEGRIGGGKVSGLFAGDFVWSGELHEQRVVHQRSAAGLIGAWAIDANGYKGRPEFGGRPGAPTGRVFFDAHQVWEDLAEVQFDEVLAELRFPRPGPGQRYRATLDETGLSGTFDDAYLWWAEPAGASR